MPKNSCHITPFILGYSCADDSDLCQDLKITVKEPYRFEKGSYQHKILFFLICFFLLTTINPVEAADCDDSSTSESSSQPLWQYILNLALIIILILFSGLFSGLTLGLLGLDKIGLQIVIDGGSKDLANHAKKIQPLRENGNLLLCTLLLGNVAVNALLSILLADMTSGLVGFLVSTILIVIFGEIVPQASCSRYALQIGGRVVPIVKVIIILLYVFAKPLSMMLDLVLGDEIGTIHSRRELMKLLQIHVEHGTLDVESGNVVEGALKYKEIKVEEVMTPIEDCFMLPMTDILDFKTISQIFQSGFSRIPVYGSTRDEIVGIILTKDLIFIDPEDSTPIQNFINIFGREILIAYPDQKLGEVLAMFKKGQGHMALVRKVNTEGPGDPFYEGVGIITLEDIVEEILGDEIVDETDVFVDVGNKSRVLREHEFDYTKLSLLDNKIGQHEILTPEEVNAITIYLKNNVAQFQRKMEDGNDFTDEAIKYIITHSKVLDIPGTEAASGMVAPPEDYFYNRGKVTSMCTLVLSGKFHIRAGRDEFRSEAGPWSVIAADALTSAEGTFVPDFSAFVAADPVKCIQIPRSAFEHGLKPPKNRPLEMFDSRLRNPRQNTLHDVARANIANAGRSHRQTSRLWSLRSKAEVKDEKDNEIL